MYEIAIMNELAKELSFESPLNIEFLALSNGGKTNMLEKIHGAICTICNEFLTNFNLIVEVTNM